MNNEISNNFNGDDRKQKFIEEKFDVTGLILEYLNNWKFFIISLAICLGVSFWYIRTIIPTYRVGASIYLNDDTATKTSAITMSPVDNMMEMKNSIDETELEILKSRNSLMQVVDTLGLSYSYFTVGKWRDIPVYKTNPVIASMDSLDLKALKAPLNLLLTKEDDGKIHIKISYRDDYEAVAVLPKLPGSVTTPAGKVYLKANKTYETNMKGEQLIRIVKPSSMAARVASNLKVQYAENALTIVNFEYVTPLPDQGTDLLKMIIYFYNRRIIEDKNKSAIQTEEFIQARLKDIQDELKGVEENLREYRTRHNIVNTDAQIGINLSRQQAAESSLNEILSQERLVNDMISEVNNLEISASRTQLRHLPTGIVQNPGINSAVDNFNRSIDRYNTQRAAMTEEMEIITNLIASLRDQKSQIMRSLESAKRQLGDQRRSMSNIESRSNSQLASQPTVDKGLQEIFRDQSVKANIYTFLLQQREEIALQKTLAIPTAQFIDDPSVITRVAPQSSRIYLMGVLIGLLIPALILFLKFKFFPKFKDRQDVTRITSVPVISEISLASEPNQEIVVGENVSTSIAELFRLLRNNLNFARAKGDNKVILVTSAISGEGKTFVALNLALTYAITGKKTVVVGLDIRRPVMAHKLGLSNQFGVTSYLSDQVSDVRDIIFPTDLNPNLFAVPAGPIPPNPNELLLSDRMAEFFNQLRQEFDYIIVDSAPLGLVSDSLLIIPHTDIQLFISRASYSTKRGIHTLHEAINNGFMTRPYIVLNGVNMKSTYYQYRNYGTYYSSAKSGYGYNERKGKKKGFFLRKK